MKRNLILMSCALFVMLFTSPHIACITLGPKKRNLTRTCKNIKDRYLLCARWNFIKEDIINFKKEKLESKV